MPSLPTQLVESARIYMGELAQYYYGNKTIIFVFLDMPTRYKRKGNYTRGAWSEEALILAVEAVRNGTLGVNEAARQFKVPCTTLRRRLKTENFSKKGLGPHSFFGEENERKIVVHIKKLQKNGFAPTRTIVREMAFRLAEQLGIPHKFNKQTEKAGFDWLRSFLERNRDLSVRKSEGVSLARARGMNRKDVANYFELLENTLQENLLLDKPGSIFNMDETGLQLNNRPEHVIAEKGSKNIAAVTSGEKGETVTVISCCNAEGIFLPPVCIFKGKNKKREYEDGMPPGSLIYMSEKSAYVNVTIFLHWLRDHFMPRKPQGPVVLILDGHASHCSSVEVLEFADSNNIILLCLPSHTTQFLQPLDRAFFKSLKSYYYAACNSFIRANPNRSINRLQFGKLLGDAWSKSATVGNATSAFRATGIFPLSPDIIPEYAYLNANESTLPVNNLEINVEEPNALNDNKTMHEEISNEKEIETPGKMLNTICPVPSTSKITSVQKRSRQLAEVLTSPESIEKRKAVAERRNKRLEKKKNDKKVSVNKVVKRKKVEFSESSSNSEVEVQNDDDDDDKATCVGCGEMYKKTKSKKDWIMCISCNRWLHEDCTSFQDHCLRCGRKKFT